MRAFIDSISMTDAWRPEGNVTVRVKQGDDIYTFEGFPSLHPGDAVLIEAWRAKRLVDVCLAADVLTVDGSPVLRKVLAPFRY